MKRKITIKFIAKELSVSTSTVSKALNDSYEISDKTKKKIQDFAKLHNYKPNTLALNLQNKKTKTIGIILPSVLNHFFARVFSGIEKEALARGYNIITCITNESYKKEVNTMEMLSNGTIDGFIAAISEETLRKQKFDHFNQILKEDMPIVLYDRITDKIDCDKVIIDDLESAYNATKYLLNLNCKNIAFISTINSLTTGKLRAKGFEKAMKEHDKKIDKNLLIKLDKKTDLVDRLQKLFTNNKVDGIFTVDESSAAVAIQELHKKGLRVPEDVSIVGFTNGILSKHITPALTTVNQFGKLIGKTATQMLIERLENEGPEKPFETKVIKTELIIRNSTKIYS